MWWTQPARTFKLMNSPNGSLARLATDHECPLLDEIRATSPGHARDCYLIDDARLFMNPPPPPHDPAQWPTFDEILALFAQLRPRHSTEIVSDVIVVETIQPS